MPRHAKPVTKLPDVNSSISSAGVESDVSLPSTPRPTLRRRVASPVQATYPPPPHVVAPQPTPAPALAPALAALPAPSRVNDPYGALTMTDVHSEEPIDLSAGGRSPRTPNFPPPPRSGVSFEGTTDDSAVTHAVHALSASSITTLPHGASVCYDAQALSSPLPMPDHAHHEHHEHGSFPQSPLGPGCAPSHHSRGASPLSEFCPSPSAAREIVVGSEWPIPPPGDDGVFHGEKYLTRGGGSSRRRSSRKGGRSPEADARSASPDDVAVSARRSPVPPGSPTTPSTVHTTVAAVTRVYHNGRPVPVPLAGAYGGSPVSASPVN